MELLGCKLIGLSIFLIKKFNQLQFFQMFLYRFTVGMPSNFITQNTESFIRSHTLFEKLNLSLFYSGHKECLGI